MTWMEGPWLCCHSHAAQGLCQASDRLLFTYSTHPAQPSQRCPTWTLATTHLRCPDPLGLTEIGDSMGGSGRRCGESSSEGQLSHLSSGPSDDASVTWMSRRPSPSRREGNACSGHGIPSISLCLCPHARVVPGPFFFSLSPCYLQYLSQSVVVDEGVCSLPRRPGRAPMAGLVYAMPAPDLQRSTKLYPYRPAKRVGRTSKLCKLDQLPPGRPVPRRVEGSRTVSANAAHETGAEVDGDDNVPSGTTDEQAMFRVEGHRATVLDACRPCSAPSINGWMDHDSGKVPRRTSG